ncbi:MAG: hypothetical protein QOD99_2437 [Chthoniobacter sp.]|nr:hypothetical protein [Chthoniobacter sp.]
MALTTRTSPARPSGKRRLDPPSAPPSLVAVPYPVLAGSAIFLLGLLATGLLASGKTSTEIARFAAIGTGISMVASFALDARVGMQNLVRADILALLSLYFLTFCEFLFPQPTFATMVDSPAALHGVWACLTGFAGLVIGRHLPRARRQPFGSLLTQPVSTTLTLGAFAFCFFDGFAYMLACSDFDPIAMVGWFFEPRFSQPWSREALGDWRALLHELEMLLFLVPPLGGVILARRKRYSLTSLLLVSLGVAFVLFYGFCNGTRYFVAAYLVTMLAGFAFAASPSQKKEVIAAAVTAAALMLIATAVMLEFRHMGLRAYALHDYEDFRRPEDAERTLYVDFNLYVISRITEVFPRRHDYLGFEIPILALVRPVPRALWSGKPQGMSFPIEDVIGARGWTVAATFVGEAYMSGGYFAVFAIACVLGALARWWNLFASPRNSEFGVLIYASGFFAAAIAMRSILVLTTALLPSLAGIIAGYFIIRRDSARRLLRPPMPRKQADALTKR